MTFSTLKSILLPPKTLQNCKTGRADRHNNNKVHNYGVQKNLTPAEICIHLEDLALNDCGLVTAGCKDLQASFTQYWAGSEASICLRLC